MVGGGLRADITDVTPVTGAADSISMGDMVESINFVDLLGSVAVGRTTGDWGFALVFFLQRKSNGFNVLG